jgi:nicotinamidase-related amidase
MLLIVDAQVNQFEPPMAVHDGPVILDRLKRLVARARAANVPIAFIQNDGGEADPDLPGTPGWALHPELLPTGSRSGQAVAIMKELGFSDVIDAGAYVDLAAAGAPTAP